MTLSRYRRVATGVIRIGYPYAVEFGLLSGCNCPDADAILFKGRIPEFVSTGRIPVKVCFVAMDEFVPCVSFACGR